MYCSLADILALVPEDDLIQLTDDTNPPASVDETKVDRAIGDAGELIDGYLRGRYDLPLSPVPGLLNTLAADIAVYRLYARRVKLTPPEGVSERYKHALKLLDKIRSGELQIGATSTGGASDAASQAVFIPGPDRIMGRRMP